MFYYKDELGNYYCYKKEHTGLIAITQEEWEEHNTYNTTITQEQIEAQARLAQIAELKKELASSDYKALKYMEGFISESEYAPIKAYRQSLRDRINALESV